MMKAKSGFLTLEKFAIKLEKALESAAILEKGLFKKIHLNASSDESHFMRIFRIFGLKGI